MPFSADDISADRDLSPVVVQRDTDDFADFRLPFRRVQAQMIQDLADRETRP